MLEKQKATLRIVDDATGELLEQGRFVYLANRPLKIKEPWHMSFEEGHKQLASYKLSGNTFQVLNALLARLNWDNWIVIRKTEIAEFTGIHPNNINRSLDQLIKLNIVEKGPKLARGIYSYRLNHAYAWKGQVLNLRKEQAKHLKLVKPTPINPGG